MRDFNPLPVFTVITLALLASSIAVGETVRVEAWDVMCSSGLHSDPCGEKFPFEWPARIDQLTCWGPARDLLGYCLDEADVKRYAAFVSLFVSGAFMSIAVFVVAWREYDDKVRASLR